jgi:hypothetical protein
MKIRILLTGLFFSSAMAHGAPLPELDSSKDQYLLILFQDQLFNYARDLSDLRKTGKDREAEEHLAFVCNAHLFELWLFYCGPEKVAIDNVKLLDILRKHCGKLVVTLKEYPSWRDPLRAMDFLEHMTPEQSLADNEFQMRIRCLDFKTIKKKQDYEDLVTQFHQWLTELSAK